MPKKSLRNLTKLVKKAVRDKPAVSVTDPEPSTEDDKKSETGKAKQDPDSKD